MTDRKPGKATYSPATTGNHALFTLWARSHGVQFPKLIPAYLPPAGLGIISTEEIQGPSRARHGKTGAIDPGETIAFTPASVLLTRENIEKFSPGEGLVRLLRKRKDDGGLSSHAVFAAAIAREVGRIREGATNMWREWIEVWPCAEEFRGSMPIMWTPEEKALLPPSTRRLLQEQEEKFDRDFEMVLQKGLKFSRDEYLWAWIVVNTRTLFYKPATGSAYDDLPRDDCMAMCPFIDYFNHSDDGCKVELTPSGYSVIPTEETLPPNTQLFVTYGCHGNDFLLVEYGFVLPSKKNKWDEVSMTPTLLPLLSAEHKRVLAAEGFLGQYVFDKETFCFRTQAAVRLMLIEHPESRGGSRKRESWKLFLAGQEDGERERFAVEEKLLGFLEGLEAEGMTAISRAEGLDVQSVREVIIMRWEQILKMTGDVRANLVGEEEERQRRRYVI